MFSDNPLYFLTLSQQLTAVTHATFYLPIVWQQISLYQCIIFQQTFSQWQHNPGFDIILDVEQKKHFD